MRSRAALAALLLLASCRGDAGDATRAVRAYDDALVLAYARNDAAPLTGLATGKEQARVQVLVDLKAAGKLVLDARIESFEVTAATASGDGATVETRERWRYHDRPAAPGGRDGPEFVADMRMRYDLVREAGRWKVAAVSTLTNEYLQPAGGGPPPGLGRAHGAGAPSGP